MGNHRLQQSGSVNCVLVSSHGDQVRRRWCGGADSFRTSTLICIIQWLLWSRGFVKYGPSHNPTFTRFKSLHTAQGSQWHTDCTAGLVGHYDFAGQDKGSRICLHSARRLGRSWAMSLPGLAIISVSSVATRAGITTFHLLRREDEQVCLRSHKQGSGLYLPSW